MIDEATHFSADPRKPRAVWSVTSDGKIHLGGKLKANLGEKIYNPRKKCFSAISVADQYVLVASTRNEDAHMNSCFDLLLAKGSHLATLEVPLKSENTNYEPNFLVMVPFGRVKLALSTGMFEYLAVMVVSRHAISLVAEVMEVMPSTSAFSDEELCYLYHDPAATRRRYSATFLTGGDKNWISYFTIQL